jgi:ATP-dependent DNA helicase RecG
MDPLERSLSELEWVPPQKVRLLVRLGMQSWRQLLEHYPRRHEDRTRFERFPTGGLDRSICVCGRIGRISVRYFSRRKIIEANLEESTESPLGGRLVCRWFNQHYIQRMLAEGQEMIVFGRPKEGRGRIFLDHPEFEIIDDEGERWIHMDRIAPIYPLTEGLRQRALRELIYRAVEALDSIPDQAVVPDHPGSSLRNAVRQIHFPDSFAKLEEARQQLALAELVSMRVVVEHRRRWNASLAGESHARGEMLVTKFLGALPFSPTGAQRRAISEIRRDLASVRPMSRLLQGDVGAGKTLVATAAILFAKEAGFQSAFMAPTQVLAEQHYRTLHGWLDPLGVKLTLKTGARQETSFLELQGSADVIVGTHALLYDEEPFMRLGLVVIDEQHKFGVLQRAKLVQRVPVPDLLVMTATPIPRTLAMTVYGDLDVSVLDEKPVNRRPVITGLRSTGKIPEAATFLRERIASGRQAYIVYPVIEESDSLSVKAATTEYQKWQQMLAPATCGLIHGRLDSQEKDHVMADFRDGQIQVLISTSVIEVGIDVENATVMLIENAERFGLAQLHQLRGRVGRGRHQSYCVLLTESEDPAALEKLRVLEKTENGFEIAEADLRLRGPGDFLGTAQSGLPPLRLASLIDDEALLLEAKEIARNILDRDSGLQAPENQRLRRTIVEAGKSGTTLAN